MLDINRLLLPKEAVCGGIGCENGTRKCGTAGATISIGYKGSGLEVDVNYTCYEDPPSQ